MTRVLAIARNIDAPPPGSVPLFLSVTGAVANDGASHELAPPAGVPVQAIDPTYRLRIARVRVEWSTLDLTVPPPLALQLQVKGQSTAAYASLARVTLLAVAMGTPALERHVFVEAFAGATLTVSATNTGAIAQQVSAYLWGWAYPSTLEDGVQSQ